jgi:hypothetical protein
MRRHTITTALTTALTTAGLVAALAACTGSGGDDAKPTGAPATSAAIVVSEDANAAAVWHAIHAAVPTSAFNQTVTADGDSNHLLGRPHEYTSAVKFKDSRVKGDDVIASDQYDVSWGGGIEVFASHDDAQTRADYIQSVTKGLPLLGEYDYVHGKVLVRVSHYLTRTQAAEYDRAAAAGIN